jgi:hypothetical protein
MFRTQYTPDFLVAETMVCETLAPRGLRISPQVHDHRQRFPSWVFRCFFKKQFKNNFIGTSTTEFFCRISAVLITPLKQFPRCH